MDETSAAIVGGYTTSLAQWLEQAFGAARASDEQSFEHWHVLLDQSAFSSIEVAKSRAREIDARPAAWINLYDDFDGLELKQRGPLLAQPPVDALSKWPATPEGLHGLSFLATQAHQPGLIDHLRSIREVILPDGSGALFRFEDPRVLAALASLLTKQQSSTMLGPSMLWCCANACGEVFKLVRQAAPPARALELTRLQLDAIDEALLPHQLLAQTREADSSVLNDLTPCQQLKRAHRHLLEAKDRGLKHKSDRLLFAVLAFQLPLGFAERSPFDSAVEFARDGRGTFSEGLDRVEPQSWQAWNDLLAERDRI